jgi:hypothetical protein
MPARSDRYFKVSRATRNDSYVLFCSVQEQLALLLLSWLPLFMNCLEEVFSETQKFEPPLLVRLVSVQVIVTL